MYVLLAVVLDRGGWVALVDDGALEELSTHLRCGAGPPAAGWTSRPDHAHVLLGGPLRHPLGVGSAVDDLVDALGTDPPGVG